MTNKDASLSDHFICIKKKNNVSHNWLISIGSMVIQGSLNIYDVSQIWYTPMWWCVSFFSSVSLDPVGKEEEEEIKEGKR